MAALLDTWVIWKGLRWLCFVELTLLCLALLFPRADLPSRNSEKSRADSSTCTLSKEPLVTQDSHR
jgi:hypothetical protein